MNGYKGKLYARCCYRLAANVPLRSESPSGMCAKLHTVAENNNRDHMPRSLYYCLFAPHIYGCYSSGTSRSWLIAHSTQHQHCCLLVWPWNTFNATLTPTDNSTPTTKVAASFPAQVQMAAADHSRLDGFFLANNFLDDVAFVIGSFSIFRSMQILYINGALSIKCSAFDEDQFHNCGYHCYGVGRIFSRRAIANFSRGANICEFHLTNFKTKRKTFFLLKS